MGQTTAQVIATCPTGALAADGGLEAGVQACAPLPEKGIYRSRQ